MKNHIAFAFVPVACLVGCLLGAGAAQGAGKRALEGVVNINTAGAEELQLLPGIGPAKARSILEYRRARPFRTVEELVRIKGIGRKMVKRLRLHVTVSGPTTARPLDAPRESAQETEPPPIRTER